MTFDRPAYREPAGSCSVREITAGPAGPVRIELRFVPSGGQLLISGPSIPLVSVQRIESAKDLARRERADARAVARGKPTAYESHRANRFRIWAAQADLFSRRPRAVSMRVAGVKAELRPGGGHLLRSSFDVRAQVNARNYLLSQSGRRAAQVLRDGRLLARLRRKAGDRMNRRYDGDVIWEAGADDVDVAITHALANAYRVGSDGFLLNLLKWIAAVALAVAFSG
ncbi:MAG: hypothetical protein J2P27_14675 [Actinobacteria bacterium]|nr:hypothetical protein [Actinomycetota bacterium]